MPKIIWVSLTPEQRTELNRQARAETLAPRLRVRIEMIRLSDLGHTIPQIAVVLDQHEQTVRKYVKAFLATGFAALPDAARPGKPAILTDTHLGAVERLLDEAAAIGQTWTAPHLVQWLYEQFGITISAAWLSERLKARKFRWKRTQRSVRHKQKDPDLQSQKEAELEVLKF